ncbi:uncharacterized protein [Temnothorax nylanderi]|uniref:uncharacterized protein isoform X1 n=1 Tax=Temnothorax nylanderi TaxID=102681 RepID=UPI003A8AE8FA
MRHRRRTTERRRRRPGGHQVTAKQSSDQCSVSNSAVAHRPLLVELDNKAQVTQLLGDEKSSTRCGSRSSLANIEREQSHEEVSLFLSRVCHFDIKISRMHFRMPCSS